MKKRKTGALQRSHGRLSWMISLLSVAILIAANAAVSMIDSRIGLQLDLSDYPKPDAVFIGGHGGKLPEMMEKIYRELTEEGVIVMNTVVQSSYDAFMESAKKLNMTLEEPVRIALDDFNPITILKATK